MFRTHLLLLLRSLKLLPFVHLKNCRKCHRLRLLRREEGVLSSLHRHAHQVRTKGFQTCQCIFSTEHWTIVHSCEQEMDENLAKPYFVILSVQFSSLVTSFGVLHHQGFGVLHQLCPLQLWITVRWAFSS